MYKLYMNNMPVCTCILMMLIIGDRLEKQSGV